jgi:hypothetical protein
MSKNDGGPAFPVCPGKDGVLFDKFVSYIDAGDWSMDRCWNWTGGRTPKGYGVLWKSKKESIRAHRFSLEAYSGKQCGDMVLHKCDNPSCVNPHHLMNGDHGENMKQMALRKRAAREERHHKAKLSFNEVLAIHALHADGYTTRELAAMFHMSQPTIGQIVIGDLWPDVYALADAMLKARDPEIHSISNGETP